MADFNEENTEHELTEEEISQFFDDVIEMPDNICFYGGSCGSKWTSN